MRVDLLRRGRVEVIEPLAPEMLRKEAIKRAWAIFMERQREHSFEYDGFEVWDRGRKLAEYRAARDPHSPGVSDG
jgi:hypothetical protein